jgi:phage-related protein
MPYEILYFDLARFLENLKHLTDEQRKVVFSSIATELAGRKMDSPVTPSTKALGKGLFELRVRRNPDLLVRIFWSYSPGEQILVLSAYDKKRSPSELSQQREISRARKLLDEAKRKGYSK